MTVSVTCIEEQRRPAHEVARRHKHVLEQFREGYSLEEIAAEAEVTVDHARVILINQGETVPTAIIGGVSSIWEMDEHARRIAFASRAQRGARQALGRRGRPPKLAAPGVVVPEQIPTEVVPLRRDSYRIIAEVAAKHQVPVREMVSRQRDSKIVLARNEAIWRIRQETKLSYSQIGAKFRRDHTTIIHAVKQHALLLARQAAEVSA